MKRSLEMPVADGRTDGTEFIGPLSAPPGIQQKGPSMHFEELRNVFNICIQKAHKQLNQFHGFKNVLRSMIIYTPPYTAKPKLMKT